MAHEARSRSSSEVRRRRRPETPTVKTSVTLHEDVLHAAEAAVRTDEAETLSAFVEAAIREKLHRSEGAKLYRAYAAASQDPAFAAEMRAVTGQFDAATADGLRDV